MPLNNQMLSGPILALLESLSGSGSPNGIEDLTSMINQRESPSSFNLEAELAGLEQIVPGSTAGAHNTIPLLGDIPGTDRLNPIPAGTFPNYGFEGEHEFFKPGRLSGLGTAEDAGNEDALKAGLNRILSGADGRGGEGGIAGLVGGDRSFGDIDLGIQSRDASQTELGALGFAIPGGGIVSTFTDIMQRLGGIGVLGGSSTPIPGSDHFAETVNMGRIADRTAELVELGFDRAVAEAKAREEFSASGAADDIGFRDGSYTNDRESAEQDLHDQIDRATEQSEAQERDGRDSGGSSSGGGPSGGDTEGSSF